MIIYEPKTANGFQKLSKSAIDIGNMPLMTGPILGIMFNIIAIIAFDTTYLTSKIVRAIRDSKPTDKELITIEKVQLVNAILHLSNISLNLFLYTFVDHTMIRVL